MSDYLIIATRDPLSSGNADWGADLATTLKQSGAEVCLFLAENAAFAARARIVWTARDRLAAAGVELVADRFALEERGIADDEVAQGVRASDLGTVVDMLEQGRKAIWL